MSFHDQFRYSPEPEFLGSVLLRGCACGLNSASANTREQGTGRDEGRPRPGEPTHCTIHSFRGRQGATSQSQGPLFNTPHSNPSTHKTRRAQLSRALPSALLARPTKPSGRTCLNSEPSLPPPRAFAHRKRRAPRLSERTTTSAAMTGVSPTSPASRREGFQLANPAARKSMNAQSYRTGSTRSNAHASACP